ncbi:anti-sigma factor [Rhodobacteraceae bacterium 2CG4]|uniref:Anti-sigma factor n=1 Tax=Halovulum marinum TaxID=2662447 RepID=A0A6L5YYY8_9RHOB|nr:anti-sigma factor [Halovulum marinum]MSU88904.1 anti-sigma factor [Halovulum marinum]
MSEPTSYPGPEDDDALAAEYVLGVLGAEERAAVAARAAREAGFAARIAAWEGHLAGLDRHFAEVAPPASVKRALDRRLFADAAPRSGPLSRLLNSLALWRLGTLAAVAALVLVLATDLRRPQELTLVLSLDSADTAYGFVALYRPGAGGVEVVQTGGGAPDDGDLELWVFDAAGAPLSLGVVDGTTPPDPGALGALVDGADVAVTLEPPGGSRGRGPQGPVVATGRVIGL